MLALGVALPLWMRWVVPPAGRIAGIHYSQYERQGYSEFVLRGVGLTNQTVRFSAQEVQATVPTVWLWRLLRGKTGSTEPFLIVNDWQFESVPTKNASTNSVYSEATSLTRTLAALERWLPRAVLSNGTVRVENTDIAVRALNWAKGELMSELTLPHREDPVIVNARLTGQPPWAL